MKYYPLNEEQAKHSARVGQDIGRIIMQEFGSGDTFHEAIATLTMVIARLMNASNMTSEMREEFLADFTRNVSSFFDELRKLNKN